ncbi:hypothetical protein BE04_14985 [Sorangium cellulosum]|uniref:Secreted protein n=2 Tax=Sorangium cellulosum TaxID=56 RepID=A0A150NZW4_SORCE|nr:hypothetical protein SCE1572_38825 [Sorangium cellulosum So0157-2]KYF47935.1 hypothetical protein BE04_14985 [Sorangium cellulosum]
MMKPDLAALVASVVTLMSAFIVGCGADCESTCEKAHDAGCGYMWTKREALDPSQPPRPAWDCASLCADIERKSEVTDCTSELDDYMGCLDDQRNICETGTCVSEGIRHTGCMLSYCAKHGEGLCSSL